MLQIKTDKSIDEDKFFVSLISSEENLMVQADLDEYLLQFKKIPNEKLNFQEVPPYGTFEKRQVSNNGRHKYLDYFKNYDFEDNEVEKGSVFKSKDRIRLIYSMLCNSLEMGLVINLGLILNFMPVINKKKIKKLKSE